MKEYAQDPEELLFLQEPQASYDSNMVADIRYDKKLTSTEKLIYAEIRAFVNGKNKKCWARNDHFCNEYEISERTVGRIIKKLSELGYINVIYVNNNPAKRIITLPSVTEKIPPTLMSTPDIDVAAPPTPMSHPLNILYMNKIKYKESFEKFWEQYPFKVGKIKCENKWRTLKVYEIESILATLPDFLSYKPFVNYRHPNPLTYLSGGRWLDELPTNEPTPETKRSTEW